MKQIGICVCDTARSTLDIDFRHIFALEAGFFAAHTTGIQFCWNHHMVQPVVTQLISQRSINIFGNRSRRNCSWKQRLGKLDAKRQQVTWNLVTWDVRYEYCRAFDEVAMNLRRKHQSNAKNGAIPFTPDLYPVITD